MVKVIYDMKSLASVQGKGNAVLTSSLIEGGMYLREATTAHLNSLYPGPESPNP